MNYMQMGKYIQRLRRKRGITQEQLAEYSDISASFMGHIERGTRVPSVETVVRIARALDCSVDELVESGGSIPEAKLKDQIYQHLVKALALLEQDT